MTRPATLRRPLRRVTVGAVVVALAASGAPALAMGRELQAVVSYDGTQLAVPGVEVVSSLPALHMQVVRGDAAAMVRLAHSSHVRGVAPDDSVQVTSAPDLGTLGDSVLASEGLGGSAGRPGAGAGVRVAVVDTGVSDTAALNRASGRLVDGVDTSDGAMRTDGVFSDGYGHGTFMAGLVAGGPVAATGDKAIGIAPGATVVVVRVARQDGTTSLSRVLTGLEWLYRHSDQVDVASISLSHRRPEREYGADPLTDAVEFLRQAGVTVVVSSGNRRQEVGDPGFDPTVLTVGAADLESGRVAHFSGSAVVAGLHKPDVVASGVHVLGLLPEDSVLANDPKTEHLPGGLYRGTGTSQATAIVAGLAALVVQAHPDATPIQVKAAVRCGATDLPGRRDGAGLANATTALCTAEDGAPLEGSTDVLGEVGFDAGTWAASTWAAGTWAAGTWAAGTWAAGTWAAGTWAAGTWAAGTWAAGTWAAGTWAAGTWAAGTWAAGTWAAGTWAAGTWAASTWASDAWGAEPPADGADL